MYERFTDRAKKVMKLANQEAQRLNHEYISTEHILLGLIREGTGTAVAILKEMDIDLRMMPIEVGKLIQSGPGMVIMGRLPQTPLVKRVIERAMSEARDLKHNYVGTEHILLGLLSTEEGVAHQVLIRFGLRMDEVCEELRRIKDLAENGISITTYNRNVASIPDEKMREMLELALRLALDIPRGQRITRIEVATEETKKGG